MRKVLLGALLVANVSIMSAAIIFNPEAAGVTQTTVANTTTVNFNSFAGGAFGPTVTPIGTYSAGGTIVSPADQFSGDGTKYISVGAQSGTTSYTLTFNSAQTFFGLLWNAADAQNVLTFMNGASTVMTFNAATISAGLGAGYFGNPSAAFKGMDGTEPFVYLDFFGTAGTTFTSVKFSNNNTSTGFETDNHAILAPSVPEPSTYGTLLAGLTALGVLARRRSGRKL
jgi:PEP-CTERM motif